MQTVLTAVKRSLGALRKRLGGSQGGGPSEASQGFCSPQQQLQNNTTIALSVSKPTPSAEHRLLWCRLC